MSADKKFPIREDILTNLLSAQQWLRICLMVIFALVSWVVRIAQVIVAIIQAVFALVTGDDNSRLRDVGKVAALYQAQIWLYLTYVSDTRPFPFSDLPDGAGDLDFEQDPKMRTENTVRKAPAASPDEDNEDVFSDMSFTSSAPRKGGALDDDDDFDTSDDDNRNPQA
jgi:hypothetical protein